MKSKCYRCQSVGHVGCVLCEKVFCAYHSQVHYEVLGDFQPCTKEVKN